MRLADRLKPLCPNQNPPRLTECQTKPKAAGVNSSIARTAPKRPPPLSIATKVDNVEAGPTPARHSAMPGMTEKEEAPAAAFTADDNDFPQLPPVESAPNIMRGQIGTEHATPYDVKPTAPSTKTAAKDVVVCLEYLSDIPLDKTVKSLQVVPGSLDRAGKSNVRLAPGQPETIHDVRTLERLFSLDENGFKYVKAPTTFRNWSSQKAIGEIYLQEMEDLLRSEVEDCDEIIFFDARASTAAVVVQVP